MKITTLFNKPKVIGLVADDLLITEVTEQEVQEELKILTLNQLINWKGWIKTELKTRNITPLEEFEIKSRHKCLDCDKLITRKAKRCSSCASKTHDSTPNLKAMKGKDNPRWKGDNVGYSCLHRWVRKHKPRPMWCEKCNNAIPVDVANISGEYKRDIKDYKWLCRRCHNKEHPKDISRDNKGRFVGGKTNE